MDEVGRLELECKRLTERLRLLSEMSQEFAGGTGDYPALLHLVARRLCEVVGDACNIRMLSEDGAHFEASDTAYYRDGAVGNELEAMMRDRPQRSGEGISGRVAASGRSILIPSFTPEVLGSLEGETKQAIERLGLRSLLAVPLCAGRKVIGVASMFRTSPDHPYTEDDLRLVEDLASHASLAIANGRLIEASRLELAERMEREQVLRRSFLEAAPDAVLITDASGRIILVNSQTEALFGYQRAELIGEPIEILVPARFRDQHPSHRSKYFGQPDARPMGANLNLFAVKKDGSEFAAEISLSPIATAEGTLVAAAVRDVTDRKREMEERNQRMQEANRLKSEFLANMSHELRTPLNAIIGFASLLHGGKAGPVDPVHQEYLGDILTSSHHLLQLINDVLDLAKVESGRTELHPESVAPAKLANEVKDIVRGLAAEKRIHLRLEIDGAVAQVRVDPRMLKQILYNYLSNAIKFTPEGGTVTLRIAPEQDGSFRIDVEDTGIGIKPEDTARLFVEFQQLDQGMAKKYPGTGLGLALTKRLVEAHGGRVEVKSAPGKGSTFSAVLPREVKGSN